ncbi:All-trans-phytoene synthase [Methyloligella halotolerans]|uniref:All-trans-phytoene synthase n=1 Tax=Methyloligella halotolerans TaxID=1177755 RepID=A0A1E2S2M2_9HYPH|nr:phytoene/squalene synthase family protein [Methyloligella halotolerans]ODA68737.1 All-trans-phytoene synthase [Methyloligella halotolerans]
MEEAERRKTVRDVARAQDPDRYLATLFAPAAARDALFALYAFNAELARIADEVSEPTLGEIRLQWWRDAMRVAVSGERTGNPVADALGAALKTHDIPVSRLDPMIHARRFDVLERIMPDSASLFRYLDDTAGQAFLLAAEFMGCDAERATPAAMAAGRAYGLTGLMRAVTAHAARNRLYLPVQNLQTSATQRLLAGEADPAFLGLMSEMRRQARAEFETAQPLIRSLPREAQAAFKPLALVEPYLDALEAIEDPMVSLADINPLRRLWRLTTWRP